MGTEYRPPTEDDLKLWWDYAGDLREETERRLIIEVRRLRELTRMALSRFTRDYGDSSYSDWLRAELEGR